MSAIRAFLSDERGATAIEYALIGGCIFMVIVASLTTVGTRLSPIFTNVASNLR